MSLRAKRIIEAIAISLTVVSCVKDVILDAGDEPQVVVDCILTDEPVQTLYLVYTKGASREKAPDLLEATAVLTDLTEGREAGRFERAADGSWRLNYAAVPTHEYRLDVTVPDHEPIWAEQTMPEEPGIGVGWHSWNPGDWGRTPLPPNDIDNNVGYTFRLRNPHDPVWFYGVNYPTMDSSGEHAEFLSTNSKSVDPFNEAEGWSFVEEGNGNYLWGSDKSSGVRTTFYPALQDTPRHKRYLRFPVMEYAPDTPFYVSGSLQGCISDWKNFRHAEVRPAELRYFSASEDYDLFLRDSYHLMDLKTSTEMADIFVRDNIYSNVHGAIGLFGAKVEKRLEWEGRDTWQANGYFLLPQFVSTYTGGDANGNLHPVKNAVLHSYPFELLHFEYLRIPWDKALPGKEPVWSPEPKNNNGSFYLDIIQDQTQLDAVGLGDCSEIDFSKKKVLVCAIGFANAIPVLIGYGYPSGDMQSPPWPSGMLGPIILYAETSYTRPDGIHPATDTFYTPFRCALLVDKDDSVADNGDIGSYMQFCNHFSSNEDRSRALAESLAWNIP